MATRAQWIAATRPKTLPAAAAPVVVGAALAYNSGAFNLRLSLLSAVVALMLQIGVNYSNDYSDGVRGTDEVRVGPTRLVGQGLATAAEVKRAAFLAFGVAAVDGLLMILLTGHWWLLLVGALAILSAWFYTGGKSPYGYMGLGELFVFVWFGLVAVNGTLYLQTGSLSDWRGWVLGAGAGALSCALLVANNLRDIPTDRESGKHTLAVKLGDRATRYFFTLLLAGGMAAPMLLPIVRGSVRLVDAAYVVPFLLAHVPGRKVLAGASGKDLLPILGATGRILLVWSVCVAVTLI